MNGDLSLLWWVVSVPARFVYGVAVGWSRIRFGDPDPQGVPLPPQEPVKAFGVKRC